jgi:hypothetical protein
MHDHQLTMKKSVCSFGAIVMAYLGHVISVHGVAMDTEKVEDVQSWQQPRTPCTVLA